MLSDRKLHTLVTYDEHDAKHFGAIQVPIYASSLFTFPTYKDMDYANEHFAESYIYSRGNNPTVHELEQKLAALEGGEKARCFATGMGAISAAILSMVQAGQHIVCVDQVYGPSKKLMGRYLQQFNIQASFVDGTNLAAIEAAIHSNTTLLYLESPSSLTFQLQDLEACVALARRYRISTMIDNTWATPCYQNPLEIGIDLVIHSLTKYIGGHSDAMGGVIIGSSQHIDSITKNELVLLGAVMTPQTAATVTRGLRTLPLRMERHQANARAVAQFLESMPFIEKVHFSGLASHPQHDLALKQMSGFSSLISFEAGSDMEKLKHFADQLKYFRIGFSWGGFESLVTVQLASYGTPKRSSPVVRLYIGLEEPDDLIADLKKAFANFQHD